jgi:hypothetical protein
MKIEVSEIASGFGQLGGGLQAKIVDETGKFWPVEELLTVDEGSYDDDRCCGYI